MSTANNKAVFLSYASQDAAAVQRIAETLRAAGVEVWFDQNELVGGDAWDAKIRGQIASCALFVPVISAATQARLEGYFRIEWKLAARRTHAMATAKAFLLPVVIDDTRDAEAHVPDEFREVQWTRLPAGETPEKFCARVAALLDGVAWEKAAPGTITRTGSVSPRPATGRPSRGWLAPALIAAAAGAALAVWQPWRAGDRPVPTATPLVAGASDAPLTAARRLVAQARPLFDSGDYVNREDIFLAEDLLKKAQMLDNTDAEVWAAQGQLSQQMIILGYERTSSRRESMRQQSERAYKLAPHSTEAQLAYAGYLQWAGRESALESTRLMETLLAREPANRRAFRITAMSWSYAGDIDRAMEACRRAHALPGGDPVALMMGAAQLQWWGRYAEMETALAEADAVAVTVRSRVLRVLLDLFWKGDLEAAAAALEQWPAWMRLEDRGAFVASQVWLWRREPDKAMAWLSPIARDAFHDTYYTGPKAVLLALAHEMANRPRAARDEWENARRIATQMVVEQPSLKRALAMKALALAKLGETAEAETLLRTLEQAGELRSEYWSNAHPAALLRIALGHGDEVPARINTEAMVDLIGQAFPAPRAALELNPAYDSVRAKPAFQRLIASAPAPTIASGGKTSAPGGAPKPSEKSVAVLAFKNLSGDPSREFFSDGLSEAVTEVLGRVPGLKVVGSASAFSFKGKAVPIPEIARQLGVTHLVEGTVLQDGSTVRITAKLIKADGFQVWGSDKLERELKNIFALHDEVSGLIAKNLSLQFGASSTAATVNPEAFELYIQARQAWGLRTPAGFAQAERLLNRALELEPNFARAHAALADVWTTGAGAEAALGLFRLRGSATIKRSTAAARRAIDLDPNLAEAHAALGNVTWNDWSIAEAISALSTAVTLNANYASAQQWLGRALATDGRMEEALAALRRAHELEPLSHKIADNLGIILFSAGRYTEALAQADRALALQPGSIWAWSVRAWALAELGRGDAVVAAVREVSGEKPATWQGAVAYALARAGARSEAQAMLERIAPPERSASAAAALLVLGQNDACWHALEHGSRNILSTDALLFWPAFDSIRGETRFQTMLANLGLTEAHARAQVWRSANPPEKAEAKP